MLEFPLVMGQKCRKEHNRLVHKKDNGDSVCDLFMRGNHEFIQTQLHKASSIVQSDYDTLMVKFVMLYSLSLYCWERSVKIKLTTYVFVY